MDRKVIAISVLLLFASSVSAQTSTSCSGSGRYCYADAVYQCVNGKPQVVDYCSYKCQDGACISGAIDPQINYIAPEPSSLKGNDIILYLTLAIVITAIVIFCLRLRMRK